MVIKNFTGKFQSFIRKYKYAAIILAVGLLLMAVPSVQTAKQTEGQMNGETALGTSFEEELSALLSQVQGAGEVKVLLTTQEGEETVYQENEDQSKTNDSESSRTDTVTLTDASRNQQGLIRQVIAPIYRGAVVVCQGADSPEVQLSIVDAVSKATGLRSDQISVLKMK